MIKNFYAQVAQSVEQWTENPRVGGSIPPLATLNFNFDQSLFRKICVKLVASVNIPHS